MALLHCSIEFKSFRVQCPKKGLVANESYVSQT
jgi:hypothetical protein